MLNLYIRLAGMLKPFSMLISFTGFTALIATFVLLLVKNDEAGSTLVLLCVLVFMLCLLLTAVIRYFSQLPSDQPEGLVQGIRYRFRIVIAWLFSGVLTLVVFSLIRFSIRLASLV